MHRPTNIIDHICRVYRRRHIHWNLLVRWVKLMNRKEYQMSRLGSDSHEQKSVQFIILQLGLRFRASSARFLAFMIAEDAVWYTVFLEQSFLEVSLALSVFVSLASVELVGFSLYPALSPPVVSDLSAGRRRSSISTRLHLASTRQG